MTSCRQSVTWVSRGISPPAPSSKDMQPRPREAAASAAIATTGRFRAEAAPRPLLKNRTLASIARRVEPPLGAEAEEMIDLAQPCDVVRRIEGAGPLVAEGDDVDHAEMRAAVIAAPRRGEERHEAEAP